jgi:thymidylate kinase
MGRPGTSPTDFADAAGGAATRKRRERGQFIVIAGPDGVGKTTLAEALAAALPDGIPARRFHHRIGILPVRQAARRPTTTPHDQRVYPGWLAAVKVAYLAVDQVLGWAAVIQPFVRSGGWVILERGWRDIVVDPGRYRLRPDAKLARRLDRVLPQPDLTVVLDAPASVIGARKGELTAAEIERQRIAWRTFAGRDPRVVVLDASSSPQVNVDAILGTQNRLVGSWIAVPPGRPRLTIPVGSRRIAIAGLRVYQPVTFRGLVLWMVATLAAGLGVLRMGPPVAPCPSPTATGRTARSCFFSTGKGTQQAQPRLPSTMPGGRSWTGRWTR